MAFKAISLLALLGSATAMPVVETMAEVLDTRDSWNPCLNEQNVKGKYKVNATLGALDKGWMSIGCDIKEIVNTGEQYSEQQTWNASDATSALAQSEVCGLLVVSEGNDQSYSNAVSNFFHGPANFYCERLDFSGGSSTGCSGNSIQCTESGHAAGYQVLNSFLALHNVNQGMYADLEKAKGDIVGRVGVFSDTFSPKIDKDKALKIIFDIIGIGFSIIAALGWNLVAKAIVPKAGHDALGAVKDFTNSMVSGGLTLTKDVQKDMNDALGTQNDLSDMATNLIENWEKLILAANQDIFGGYGNSSKLATMMDQGSLLGLQPLTQQQVTDNLEKALWATMMPWAWQRATDGANPVIITPTRPDASKGCDGWDAETEAYTSASDGLASFVCIDNSPYWLAGPSNPNLGNDCKYSATDEYSECDSGASTLPLLPGNDQLQSSNAPWGGVTFTDIVNGAVATYKARGNKNSADSLIQDPSNGDTISDISNNGIRAAGFFNFPVCDGKTAFVNWGRLASQQDMSIYPCTPLTGDLAHCDEEGYLPCS